MSYAVSMWSQLCSFVAWSPRVCTQLSVSSELCLPPSSLVSYCGKKSIRPRQTSMATHVASFPFTPSSSYVKLITSPDCVFTHSIMFTPLENLPHWKYLHICHMFSIPSKWWNRFFRASPGHHWWSEDGATEGSGIWWENHCLVAFLVRFSSWWGHIGVDKRTELCWAQSLLHYVHFIWSPLLLRCHFCLFSIHFWP